MDETSAVLDQVRCLLGTLSSGGSSEAGPFVTADDASLCALASEVEAVGRLVDALRIQAAGEVDIRSRIELGHDGLAYRWGHRKPEHLIEQLTRIGATEASRRIRISRAIAPRRALDGTPLPARFPAVGGGLVSGEITVDAAGEIIRCLSQAAGVAHPEMLDAAEQALVETARSETAAVVALHARVWREALDPDGAEPRDEELRSRRGFTLGRTVNGMTPISGSADPFSAALLRSLFTEGTGPGRTPRFLDPGETDDDSLALIDPRSRPQRQFDILLGVLSAGIRSSETPGAMRSLTSVCVVIRAKDLADGTGAAWLDDLDDPISAEHALREACDAGYRRIVIGDDGEVLYLGRAERLFSPAQRRALAVRDGGCVWPGCDAPPGWCQAHHVVEWSRGGLTDIDNGVLLCSAHHHMLHNGEFTMTMEHGRPFLLAPRHLDPQQRPRAVGRSRALMAVG